MHHLQVGAEGWGVGLGRAAGRGAHTCVRQGCANRGRGAAQSREGQAARHMTVNSRDLDQFPSLVSLHEPAMPLELAAGPGVGRGGLPFCPPGWRLCICASLVMLI